VVAAVGDGAGGWRTGDEVWGLVGFDRPGAAAEYVTVPVSSVLREPASGRTWRRAGCGRAQPVQGMSTSFLPLARPAATRVNAAGPSRSG